MSAAATRVIVMVYLLLVVVGGSFRGSFGMGSRILSYGKIKLPAMELDTLIQVSKTTVPLEPITGKPNRVDGGGRSLKRIPAVVGEPSTCPPGETFAPNIPAGGLFEKAPTTQVTRKLVPSNASAGPLLPSEIVLMPIPPPEDGPSSKDPSGLILVPRISAGGGSNPIVSAFLQTAK